MGPVAVVAEYCIKILMLIACLGNEIKGQPEVQHNVESKMKSIQRIWTLPTAIQGFSSGCGSIIVGMVYVSTGKEPPFRISLGSGKVQPTIYQVTPLLAGTMVRRARHKER